MPLAPDPLLAAARSAFDLVSGTTSARLGLAHLASLVGEDRLPRDLRRLAAPPEPISWRDVERTLKSAWGRPPARVLAGLDREPVAVTPAAQVHRGEHEDGTAVAVKVRRPGLAEILRSDLVLVDAAAGAFGAILPALDLPGIVAEMRERLLDELDLEYEAGTQRRFARAFRDHPRLHVPAPRMALCEEAVLVADWVDGTSVRHLGADGEPGHRVLAAEALLEFFVLAATQVGVAIADPHPDDALLQEDGRLAVVDFGATREVSDGQLDRAREALGAFADGDAGALAGVLDATGWLPGASEADARQGLGIAEDLLGEVLRGDAPLSAGALEDAGLGLRRHADVIAAQAARSAVPAADLWPLRGAAQLGLVLAHLEVQADWVGTARSWLG